MHYSSFPIVPIVRLPTPTTTEILRGGWTSVEKIQREPTVHGDMALWQCICEFFFFVSFLIPLPLTSPGISDGNSELPRPVRSGQVADEGGSICQVAQTETRPAGNMGPTKREGTRQDVRFVPSALSREDGSAPADPVLLKHLVRPAEP